MPAPRLVRASDRVAVWHEAADDDEDFAIASGSALPPEGYTPVQHDEPIDVAPIGGGDMTIDGGGTIGGPPVAPVVVIPNTNKFKTPANGLKKLLDTVDNGTDDKTFYGPNAHPKVQDWLDKHPAFTKTYLKPDYQDALKATLGDANYEKLLYHAPKPHAQALTIHPQKPAPNSNKFKTPANGLKKLLDNPNTTPDHVKAWIDKHPDFTKYLHNPSYQDAIKGALGEQNYQDWQEHLGVPAAKPQKKTLEQKTQDIADAFAPAGFVPKTQEQFFEDHVGDSGPQPGIQGEMSPEDQAEADAIKSEMPVDPATVLHKTLVQNAKGLGGDVETLVASPQYKEWFAKQDILKQKAFAKTPEKSIGYFTQDTGFDTYPDDDDQADIDAIKQQMPESDIDADWKKAFPKAISAPSKEKMELYLKGMMGTLKPEDQAAIQAIYDKHFGPQPATDPTEGDDTYTGLVENSAYNDEGKYADLFAQPEFKQWWAALPQSWKYKYENDSESAVNDFGIHKSQMPSDAAVPPEDQPEVDAIKQQAVAEGIKAIFPNVDPSVATMPVDQQKKLLEGWATHLAETPGHKDNLVKLKALYDQHFGQTPQPAPVSPPAAPTAPGQDEWEQQLLSQPLSPDDQAEADAIKQQMPAAGLTPYEPDMPHLKKSNEQLTSLLQEADPSYWYDGSGNLDDFLAASPEVKKSTMQHWIDQGVAPGEAKIYQQIIDALNGQGVAQPAPIGGDYPPPEWMKKHFGVDWTPHAIKKYWDEADEDSSVTGKWKNDFYNDKAEYSSVQPSGQPSGQSYVAPGNTYFHPDLDELKTLFPENPSIASGFAAMNEKEFKDNYDFVKGQMAAGVWTNPDTPWTKIVKYIDSKAPSDTPAFAPPPPPLPPFDPAAFQVAYKAMFPGSGWDATQHTPEQTKAKMHEMVQTKINNFGYNPTTQTQIDLYEKWFGPFTPDSTTKPKGPPPPPPPAPMTPDQAYAKLVADPENGKLFGSPEFKTWFMQNPAKQISWATNPDLAAVAYEEATLPPPPPPMPFKSQPLNPDELAHWAANKPISESGWKNFSTWWANTQIPPEQEQALYKAWFDKDTSPEQAGAWFQAMFELHAQPSEGDLGLQAGLLPNWAQSTWAFGPHAAQEWPVFQAWATKDPGIPAGTKIRQKLMIWNSLSPEDKQAIADNYLPSDPVDTQAVIGELAKAYPDSDWSAWAQMGQGTLKSNLAMLAETGAYPGAIAAYNKYFGGNIPMPEPVKPGQKPKKPKTIPSLPVSKMPKWTQSYGQFTQDEDGARKYTHFLRFAESIGRGPEAKGEVPDKEGYSGRPYSLMMMWNAVPPHLKAQLALMPTLPWKDEDGFKAWVAAQPTLKDEVQAIDPVAYQGQSWYTNPLNNKITLESLLDSQTDPHKKQALLDVYQKYFGAENKPTLAEVLKATDPSTDWDKYLKTTPVDTVAKLLKKKIKDEKDPDKFIRYCDIWSKFFTGPPGNKALSSVLGKGHTGGKPLSASDLQKLWNWKAQGDPTAPVGVYGWQEAASPYIEQQQKEWSNQGYYPRYYGWTPPWEPGSATPYVPDPALLGSSPTATYELPQLTKSQDYQDLLQSVNTFVPWLLSPHDKNVLKSDQFQNWFENASPAYKAQYKDHPGTAVSDFEKFIDQGGTTYGPVVGDPAVNPKVYDLSPFNMIPKPSDKDIGGHKFKQEFTHNKPRWDQVKFPRKLDPQETLPLQPGDRWAPDYAAMPIYRLIPNDVLDLDATPRLSSRYDNLPPRQKEYQLELQRWRLRKIDQIINGPNAKRDFASDKKYFDNWCSSHDITPDQKKDIENTIFAVQPILSDDQKWKYFEDWAAKNNVEPSAMYDLASKVGVGNPGEGVPNQQGNYDSPELAQLILDYLENGRGGDTMGGGLGGLGVHWTRAKDLLYHPKDSGMGGANAMKPGGAGTNVGGRRIPIYLWALWPGAGESSGGGGAYSADTDSELEHMLQQGAKVFLRRLQIRDEKGDFHDLIDPGPISTWARGRDESSSGRNSQDKESLAARLDYDLPDVKHDPEEWDYLAPGPEADAKFAKLFEQYGLLSPGVGLKGEHPEYMKSKDPDHPHPEWQEELSPQQQKIKQKLLKAYEHFFVGKPHLPPAHFRFASQSTHRVAAAEQLFDMATVWGVRDAEKYGMPMHLARALRPQPKPRVVAYDAPRGGIEVRKRPGIVTVHERYL